MFFIFYISTHVLHNKNENIAIHSTKKKTSESQYQEKIKKYFSLILNSKVFTKRSLLRIKILA